jgi:Cof subfamily protein (haloacid dehalogenase superfamily)
MVLRIQERKFFRICRSWWDLWSGDLDMNVKLIVTDLDGTLLRTDKTISRYTIDVLRRLREEGIKIVFATARSTTSMFDFTEQVPIDGLCASNGSVVIENGIEIKRYLFVKADQQAIISYLKNDKNVYRISTKNAIHSYYYGLSINDSSVYYDFPDEDKELFSTIAFRSTYPESALNFLATMSGIHYYRVTGEELTDILPKSASKWNAIRFLSEKWGIKTSEIICFGDDYNDIEMLSVPGVISVAVENALAEVKAVSNYVCGSNDDDGVAKWMEENVL